nr:MAG: replication associated protein [Cressdnaviricota sp.]
MENSESTVMAPMAPCLKGNTRPLGARISASKSWIFTYFYTKNEEEKEAETIKNILAPICKSFLFCPEICPDTKNTHFQGFCVFKTKQRPSEFIKTARWKKMRGTIEENIIYCTKENRKIYTNMKFRKKIIDPLDGLEYFPYQKEVINIITGLPDKRKLFWWWEPTGNRGKSTFSKHLVLKYDALVIFGRSQDIKYILAKRLETEDVDIIVFDFPRGYKNYINYTTMEEIKNGLIVSGKYEGQSIVYNVPHIICFANFPPEIDELSYDKWDVRRIPDEL